MRPAIETLVEQIYEAALDPAGWERVLRDLQPGIGAASTGIGLPVPTPDGPGRLFAAVDVDPDFEAATSQAFLSFDEGGLHSGTPVGVALSLAQRLGTRAGAACRLSTWRMTAAGSAGGAKAARAGTFG